MTQDNRNIRIVSENIGDLKIVPCLDSGFSNDHRSIEKMMANEAWSRISDQIENFQDRMNDHDLKHMVVHYDMWKLQFSKISGFDKKGKPACMESLSFGKSPDEIHFERSDIPAENVVHVMNLPESQMMNSAIKVISDNISRFIKETRNTDKTPITNLNFSLNESGEFNITTIDVNGVSEKWTIPDVTDTFRQLNRWLAQESETLVDGLTSRFARILSDKVEQINNRYPGLDLTPYSHARVENYGYVNEIRFNLNSKDGVIDSDAMTFAEFEKSHPGLVKEMRDFHMVINAALFERGIGINHMSLIDHLENKTIPVSIETGSPDENELVP